MRSNTNGEYGTVHFFLKNPLRFQLSLGRSKLCFSLASNAETTSPFLALRAERGGGPELAAAAE
jgi:hypothetical protein